MDETIVNSVMGLRKYMRKNDISTDDMEVTLSVRNPGKLSAYLHRDLRDPTNFYGVEPGYGSLKLMGIKLNIKECPNQSRTAMDKAYHDALVYGRGVTATEAAERDEKWRFIHGTAESREVGKHATLAMGYGKSPAMADLDAYIQMATISKTMAIPPSFLKEELMVTTTPVKQPKAETNPAIVHLASLLHSRQTSLTSYQNLVDAAKQQLKSVETSRNFYAKEVRELTAALKKLGYKEA